MAAMMGRTVNNRRSHQEVQGQERQEGQKLQDDKVNTMHS